MQYTKIQPYFETEFKKEMGALKPSRIVRAMERCLSFAINSLGFIESQEERHNMLYDIVAQSVELSWNYAGREVFFVESDELLTALCNSKFESKNIRHLTPISNNFFLSIPSQNASEYHSFHIHWKETLDEFLDAPSEVILKLTADSDDEELAWFSYEDKLIKAQEHIDIRGGSETLGVTAEEVLKQQFIEVSMIDSRNEIHKLQLMECEFLDTLNGKLLVEQGYDIFKTIFNVTLSLAVYKSAGGNVRKGIPFTSSLTVRKNSRKQLIQPSTIELENSKQHIHKQGTIRGFHFRNLVHPRYYQNEHKNKPIGSRWSFVKPHWVGTKIDSNTFTKN